MPAIDTSAIASRAAALGLKDTSTARLTSLIDASLETIEAFCGRRFVAADVVQQFDANSHLLRLSHYPIQSVTHVKTHPCWDGTAWAYDTTLTAEEYARKDDVGHITSVLFSYGSKSVEVSYRGGYETLPAGIVEAIATQALHLATSGQRDYTLASEKIGRYAVSFRDQGYEGLSPVAKVLCHPYRRLG